MSRNGDRMNTKAPTRRRCQGLSKGIIPRVQRQFNRQPVPVEVRVLPKVEKADEGTATL